MRESLRRRLRLPPPSPPPPLPPPPPPPPVLKSHHHPPIDDELEEGELKDVDPLDQIKRKHVSDKEDEEERVVVTDDGGEGKPGCSIVEQEVSQVEPVNHGGDEEERSGSELVNERDNDDDTKLVEAQPELDIVNAIVVVRESDAEEREKESGELGGGAQGGEEVMERNEMEQGGGEKVEKVVVVDVENVVMERSETEQGGGEVVEKVAVNKENDGEEGDGTPVEEEREVSTEQQPGGSGKVENDIVMEAVEETRQLEMPVEGTQNEGKTDDEQVKEQGGPPDLAVEEIGNLTEKDDVDVDVEDGPPPGWESGPPVNPLPPLPPPPPPPPPEKGQLVCGSCRRLLSYPRGFKHVQCSCCQTVNYVLEEHQVGQVQCGNCLLLLMYPFGAQSVRCCSCRFLTDIGDHNKRPRLSEQQSRACRPFCVPL